MSNKITLRSCDDCNCVLDVGFQLHIGTSARFKSFKIYKNYVKVGEDGLS